MQNVLNAEIVSSRFQPVIFTGQSLLRDRCSVNRHFVQIWATKPLSF